MTKLHEGDKVSWKTSSGRTKGKVAEVKKKPFQLNGTKIKADKKDPRYIVKSKDGRSHQSHGEGSQEALTCTTPARPI